MAAREDGYVDSARQERQRGKLIPMANTADRKTLPYVVEKNIEVKSERHGSLDSLVERRCIALKLLVLVSVM